MKSLKLGEKMKIKAIVRLCLSVMVCALMLLTTAASSKLSSKQEAASRLSPGPGDTGETYLPAGYELFKSDEFTFTFLYPSDWKITQEPLSEVDGSSSTVLIEGKSNELVSIKVFNRPGDIEAFITDNVGAFTTSEVKNIEATRSIIAGCDGYSWIAKDRGNVIGGTLVFSNDNYLFVLNFTAGDDSESGYIADLIDSISTGAAGAAGDNYLTFDPVGLEFPGISSTKVQSCCSLTDSGTNNYPCCTTSPYGNCTWYCEYRISGSNSFPYYGDAYMWLYNARYNGTRTYPTGGTIPEAGAIMVFDSGWYTSGHVAYITSVATNGSLNVNEQGWCAYCTRSNTYTTSTLRSYLAGYIYVDGSTPEPTAKSCSGASAGTSTIIDDFNFTNVYNFQTYGPGSGYGWYTYNGGYNSFFHWTTTRSSALSYGKWKFTVTATGLYELQAYIPSIHGTADNARYKVGSTYSSGINQLNYSNVFVKIVNPGRTDGYWSLSSGTTYEVRMEDHYAGTAGKELAMDAIKVIRR